MVVCVTGLENVDPMESWWIENGGELERQGMAVVDHACITASKGKKMKDGKWMYEDEYEQSRDLVRKLVERHCRGVPWKVEKEAWVPEVMKQLKPGYEEEPAGKKKKAGGVSGDLRQVLTRIVHLAI